MRVTLFRSLRFRLIASVVAIEIVMLSIMVWNNVNTIYNTHTDRLNDTASSLLQQFASTAGNFMAEVDYAGLEEYAIGILEHREVAYVRVSLPDGRPVVSLGSDIPTTTPQLESHPTQVNDGVYDVASDIMLAKQPMGQVLIGFSLEVMQEAIVNARTRSIAIAITEIILSVIATIFIGLNLTRSLQLLSTAASRVGEGHYDVELPIKQQDEVGQTAQAFNNMVNAIAERTRHLLASQDQIRLLLDSTEEGIYGVDTKGICTFVNPSCVRMLGYTDADQLEGKNLHELIHHTLPNGEHYPKEQCKVRLATLSGESGHADDEVHWRADGSSFPVEYWSHPIRQNGEVVGTVVTFIDISQRKAAEAELNRHREHLEELVEQRTRQMKQALQEAELASRLKSQFLSRMSHELRTPLNAILGFGQLMEEENLTHNQHDNIKEIMHASHHLLGLIDEVLDLTRIEAGKLNLSMESIDVAALAEDSVAMLSMMAKQRNIRIDNRINDQQVSVYADRIRLMEVLVNLLSNAVKYNNDGGNVTLSGELIDINVYRFQVSDTGPGIAEKDQEGLFEPFNRIGKEFTTIEGTGIGLTICKQLMEHMGGAIGFKSKEGQGTSFWIDCAIALENIPCAEEPQDTEVMAASGNITTVLYIEDNPANLRLIEKLLKRYPGITMLSAPNAEMGIELARKKQPDLILLDLNLPGMDGYEALTRLRIYPETSAIPVIAVTAAAMPNDIRRGQLAGFKHYITKPVRLSELRAILNLEFAERYQTGKG